jgi:hypothetical protein
MAKPIPYNRRWLQNQQALQAPQEGQERNEPTPNGGVEVSIFAEGERAQRLAELLQRRKFERTDASVPSPATTAHLTLPRWRASTLCPKRSMPSLSSPRGTMRSVLVAVSRYGAATPSHATLAGMCGCTRTVGIGSNAHSSAPPSLPATAPPAASAVNQSIQETGLRAIHPTAGFTRRAQNSSIASPKTPKKRTSITAGIPPCRAK